MQYGNERPPLTIGAVPLFIANEFFRQKYETMMFINLQLIKINEFNIWELIYFNFIETKGENELKSSKKVHRLVGGKDIKLQVTSGGEDYN